MPIAQDLQYECEDGRFAVRLGFRQVSGFSFADMGDFIHKRSQHLQSPDHARRITGISVSNLERLASADAFNSMGLDRRQGLWAVRGMGPDVQLPLFDVSHTNALGHDPAVVLPQMALREHVVADYQTQRLSLKAHQMQILRPLYERGIKSEDPKQARFKPNRALTARDLLKAPNNSW